MEGSGTGIGRLDSYEDMFKEITRKLYGEDPDHRSKLKFLKKFKNKLKIKIIAFYITLDIYFKIINC